MKHLVTIHEDMSVTVGFHHNNITVSRRGTAILELRCGREKLFQGSRKISKTQACPRVERKQSNTEYSQFAAWRAYIYILEAANEWETTLKTLAENIWVVGTKDLRYGAELYTSTDSKHLTEVPKMSTISQGFL